MIFQLRRQFLGSVYMPNQTHDGDDRSKVKLVGRIFEQPYQAFPREKKRVELVKVSVV